MNETIKQAKKTIINSVITNAIGIALGAASGAFFGFTSFYITARLAFASLDTRATASETAIIEIKADSVRKDVLEQIIQPIKDDTAEIKQDVKDTRKELLDIKYLLRK